MIVKTSFISQLFNFMLIFLLIINLLAIVVVYKVNLLELSIPSLLFFSLVFISLLIINEIVIRRLYTYEISEAGIKESFILFSKKEVLVPYNNITSVNLKKSVLGRIFNYGDIEITTHDMKITLKGIKNPEVVYQKIKGLLEIFKTKSEINE